MVRRKFKLPAYCQLKKSATKGSWPQVVMPIPNAAKSLSFRASSVVNSPDRFYRANPCNNECKLHRRVIFQTTWVYVHWRILYGMSLCFCRMDSTTFSLLQIGQRITRCPACADLDAHHNFYLAPCWLICKTYS
jgi:hypothetical protein